MQDRFSLYHEVQHFIEYSKYHQRTDTKNRKSRIRSAAKQYMVQDKRLYYVGPGATRKRLVVMSEEEKLRVLQECHVNPATGGHQGKRRTRDQIARSYYWSTILGDSKRWVEECRLCQVTEKINVVAPTCISNDKVHGFALFDEVEFFLSQGSFQPDVGNADKYVIRQASKDFVLKDDHLWLISDNRLVKVVRSESEVQEIIHRYHDEKNHPSQVQAVQAIRKHYFWSNLSLMVKDYIKQCEKCVKITRTGAMIRCLAYGCESTSRHKDDGLTFYKFPKDPERLEKWLSITHRDEASLRPASRLCSRHFEDNSFHMNEEGMLTLKEDAVPTITSCPAQEEVDILSDIASQCSTNLEDLFSASYDVEIMDRMESTEPVEHVEHQYAHPPPESKQRSHQKRKKVSLKKYGWEPCFKRYDQLVQYLTNGVLPITDQNIKNSLRRMAKSYRVIDGVLMYTRLSPPCKVLRSREEVNVVFKRFHDNRGHSGQSRCLKAITKEYHWSNIGPDLSDWIANCHTCINRKKRMKLQCSVYRCNNYSGPVERSLGITFHEYPNHNPSLLDRWLQVVGRPGWYPRPLSAVCSCHFTEDCFDRAGDTVTLKPDVVPSLFLFKQPNPNTASLRCNPQPNLEEVKTQDQAFFAKYDAVELFLGKAIYPPGVNSVEKNTIRRFCRKFIIQDDLLHLVKGTKVRQVLRSREEVNTALTDYHDELNHLNQKKCLRLLSEKYFWGTMRADIALWIDKCSECSKTKQTQSLAVRTPKRTKPMEPLQTFDCRESYSPMASEACCDDDDDVGRLPLVAEQSSTIKQPVVPPAIASTDRLVQPCLYACINNEVMPCRASSNLALIIWGEPTQQLSPSADTAIPTTLCIETHYNSRALPVLTASAPPPSQPSQTTNWIPVTPKPLSPGSSSLPKLSPPAKKRRGCFPVSTPPSSQSKLTASSNGVHSWAIKSTASKTYKAWSPTVSIGPIIQNPKAPPPPIGDPSTPPQRPRPLQARTMVQLCTQATLKVKPVADGALAQWAEIQEGMVIYVCFLQGATMEIIPKMVDCLLNTKFFENPTTQQRASIHELSGDILIVPQNTLSGEGVDVKRVLYNDVEERQLGAQLYNMFVLACEKAVMPGTRCTDVRMSVKHGLYGTKQEIFLNSTEPLTHQLAF